MYINLITLGDGRPKRKPAEAKILLIGSPYAHPSREAFLKKLSTVLASVANRLDVIGANEPATYDNISWREWKVDDELSGIKRYTAFLEKQLSSVQACRNSHDVVIIRQDVFVLPTLFCRLADIPAAPIVTQRTMHPALNLLTRLNFRVASSLIIESASVLAEWKKEIYSEKALVGATYVDTDRFKIMTPFSKRDEAAGYVGILNKRKGIPNLLQALPKVTERKQNLAFHVGGDGPLADSVINTLSGDPLRAYHGFIPDDTLPEYYNQLKLLVLPSDSEGLPNVALEAMACGTPVLATSVGGVPDLITDEENGFIMPDNDPSTISTHILRALNYDSLERVSDRAHSTIQSNYTEPVAVERYRGIVSTLLTET